MVKIKVVSKDLGVEENGARACFKLFPCMSKNYIAKKMFMN
jgi:hypothetical protein